MAHLSEQLKRFIQQVSLSIAIATNQNEEFAQNLYAKWRTTQQTFLKTFYQNI